MGFLRLLKAPFEVWRTGTFMGHEVERHPQQPVAKVQPRDERPFFTSFSLGNLKRPPVFLRFPASI